MARSKAAPAPAPTAHAVKCPYCQSNLRPETARIATGEVDGSTTTLRAVPRPDLTVAEEPTTRRVKRKVKLSGKLDSSWAKP